MRQVEAERRIAEEEAKKLAAIEAERQRLAPKVFNKPRD